MHSFCSTFLVPLVLWPLSSLVLGAAVINVNANASTLGTDHPSVQCYHATPGGTPPALGACFSAHNTLSSGLRLFSRTLRVGPGELGTLRRPSLLGNSLHIPLNIAETRYGYCSIRFALELQGSHASAMIDQADLLNISRQLIDRCVAPDGGHGWGGGAALYYFGGSPREVTRPIVRLDVSVSGIQRRETDGAPDGMSFIEETYNNTAVASSPTSLAPPNAIKS